MVKNINDLESYMNQLWLEGLNSDLIKNLPLQEAFSDKRLVAIYLTQVYHYAVHTPRHQALVGVNRRNNNFKYMQYCFEHAFEETAHELMALKDIQSLGFDVTAENMPPALPSTSLLIALLYREAESETPIHHLGYGFWSENACPFITSFMENLMVSMKLQKDQLTFYSSHVTIDEGHAQEVRKILEYLQPSEKEWEGIRRVADITFQLTLGIVKDTCNAYKEILAGKNNGFEVFR